MTRHIDKKIENLRGFIDNCDNAIYNAIKDKREYQRQVEKLMREKRINDTLRYRGVKQPDFVYIITE